MFWCVMRYFGRDVENFCSQLFDFDSALDQPEDRTAYEDLKAGVEKAVANRLKLWIDDKKWLKNSIAVLDSSES